MAAKMISVKKLPVGHRLNPSDEELVNRHLNRKLLNIEEEYCSIPEFDIYKLPPWDLITKYNELSDLASDGRECFFYHRRVSSKRNNRRTKEGFWKGTGMGVWSKETDQTKWHKRYLVYYRGKQKSAEESNWAMHEYVNLADQRIVVCRIHKKEPKKGKKKVDSVSSESGPNGSPRAYECSEIQIQPLETEIQIEPLETTSPEASVNTTMASVHTSAESQNPTLTSNIKVPEFRMSSPQQMQIVAEERSSPSEDSYTDFIQLMDLEDPQHPCFLTREQSPYSENTFINECDQEDDNWSYLGHITREEGGNISVFDQTPADQSLNDVLLGSISPPQPQMMPTEDIFALIGNTSFNGSGSGSCMIHPQLDIHGHDAQFPVMEMKYGAQETNFKEAQQSTLNSQTSISPPNSNLLSPEELQMLQEWSDTCNIHSSSVSSEGGNPIAFHYGRSYELQQPNLEEAPQSTLNSQTSISPPNSDLLSLEELQMLLEWSDICNIHSSSDSSKGGNPIAFHYGQSYELHQPNLEVPLGSAIELRAATQSPDTDSWLDSLRAPSPPPYASTGC